MKRGQVTIFIIIAVVLISVIVLFFIFKEDLIPSDGNVDIEANPDEFIKNCIQEKVNEGVEIISHQGGYINPELNISFKFENEGIFTEIAYLCYTNEYYYPCLNQEPMLIKHLKDEIKKYIEDDVEICFHELEKGLAKKGITVEGKYGGFEVELNMKKIIININSKLILTKADERRELKNIEVIIPSRFYDLGIVVQEILSQEARFCAFSDIGYTLFYNQFKIDKFETGKGTKFYTIIHKDSEEWFRFALRGCVIPPGF
jgi:hypothetical protein